MNSVTLFGVRIDDYGREAVAELFLDWLTGTTSKKVFTPNPEFLLLARQQPAFAQILNSADVRLPDGVGIRFASAALSDHVIAERFPGVEVLGMLAELCRHQGARLMLVGSSETTERAAKVLQKKFLGLAVSCVDPGEVGETGELRQEIVQAIQQAAPTVLAVGLGQGKQEACITKYAVTWPSVRIAIGVGGAFAMIGGSLPRAPHALRRIGLEWLWRVAIEPTRLPRIWRAVAVFPAVVAYEALQQRRFWRAVVTTVPEVFKQLIGR